MRRGSLGRVGRRLAAPVLALMVLLVVVSTWLLYYGSGQSRSELVEYSAEMLGRTVMNSLRDAMQSEDRPRLQRQIVHIAEGDVIRGVRLVNKSGEVIFASDPAEVGRRYSQEDPGCRVCHRQEGEPPARDQIVRETDEGRRVVRSVRSVVVEKECAACHQEPLGSVLGVLITDLDEDEVTGHLRARTGQAVGSVAGMALVVVLVLFFTIRRLVVARVHALRGLLNRLRSGARSMALIETPRDEIDDLARSLQAFALDLDEQVALQRAAHVVGRVIDSHPAPVLLLDERGFVLAANHGAASRFGKEGGGPLTGRRREELAGGGGDLMKIAEEQGWALPPRGEPGPIVVTLGDSRGETIGFLEVWPQDRSATESEEEVGEPMDAADEGWMLYGAVVVEQVRANSKEWGGILAVDGRLLLGRRLTRELAQAADSIRQWAELDLDALALITLQDVQRETRGVHWHTLLGGTPKILGARYQLRVLMVHLLEAAARQAGEFGHVLLFTRTVRSRQSVILGAWASAPGGRAMLDPRGGPALARSISRAHGGGVEVDAGFDIKQLTESRGMKLPCDSVGSLYVSKLPVQLRPGR